MSIHLPPQTSAFPRTATDQPSDNAWGSQWRHLPRTARPLIRNSAQGRLRKLGD
jgi:hypothetical protein